MNVVVSPPAEDEPSPAEELEHEMMSRLTPALTGFYQLVLYNALVFSKEKAESPIELLLVGAFIARMMLTGGCAIGKAPWCFDISEKSQSLSSTQQFEWHGCRIDFAIFFEGNPIVFIECDGHEFHERTKEQAERDRSRDRAVQLAGVIALRFTGREIWRDVGVCIDEIVEAIRTALEKRGWQS